MPCFRDKLCSLLSHSSGQNDLSNLSSLLGMKPQEDFYRPSPFSRTTSSHRINIMRYVVWYHWVLQVNFAWNFSSHGVLLEETPYSVSTGAAWLFICDLFWCFTSSQVKAKKTDDRVRAKKGAVAMMLGPRSNEPTPKWKNLTAGTEVSKDSKDA